MYICSFVKYKYDIGRCLSKFPSSCFFCLIKVRSMLHHGSVGRVQNKIRNGLIYFEVPFWQNFFFFHNKICVFIRIYAVNMAYFLWGGHVS